MATFFGEVLDVSNRAYDNADDDIEATFDDESPFVVETHRQGDDLQCRVLLVACDVFSKDCVTCLFPGAITPSQSPLATVTRRPLADEQEQLLQQQQQRQPVMRIYESDKGDLYIAVCNRHIAAELSYWLAHTLLSAVRVSGHVVAVSSAPLHGYCAPDAAAGDCTTIAADLDASGDSAMARWVVGAAGGGGCGRDQLLLQPLTSSVPALEPPNLIADLPAALLLLCRDGVGGSDDGGLMAVVLQVYLLYRHCDSALLQLLRRWLTLAAVPAITNDTGATATKRTYQHDHIYT